MAAGRPPPDRAPDNRATVSRSTIARTAFETTCDLAATLAECSSGRELRTGGFADDVAVAGELDVSTAVPLRIDGAFAAAE
ncbi:hypothetical protein [Nocardia xishanensis]